MATEIEGAILYSEEQRSSALTQLERLLKNPHFSHSRRFPSFLRFIVQEELDGRGDQLKERTLGVEVFGRDPGYDTTADPIVRVTAAEIRKRIAQYYQEAGQAEEVRISLPPGSYVPHFAWSPIADSGQLASAAPPEREAVPLLPARLDLSAASENVPPTRTGWRLSWRLWAPAAIVLLLLGGWYSTRTKPSALDRFWAPLLGSNESIVVCFPRSQIETITLRNASSPEDLQQLKEKTNAVMVDDLQPLVSIAGLLETRHQRYTLMGEDNATLTDLRHGPSIFLGAFDNAWTLRVTRNLRYRFGNDPEMKHFWIEDTQSNHPHWEIDRNLQVSTNNYRDYAIVARFVDASTGQVAVVSAGIARGGTVAAGEFLTQPANMEAIEAQAPKGWFRKNVEFVLSTEIIDGRSAPPKIEATYFW